MRIRDGSGPLLVFGPRSLAYDFGASHPLTPLRFGPGIDLLRAVGAVPSVAPEPASDAELRAVHAAGYIDAVRAFSADPSRPGAMGIGLSDNPAFAGMHEAAASVAGGSLRAMEAILRGEVEHAQHPGGGLHHAMRSAASGFCIYDDPALAVVRGRADGLRVLYVDLDVHHGDGVQAICLPDPGVLTVSLHESGRYLFPGTGFPDEAGEGTAAGTAVNLPFEPYAGDDAWIAAVRALVPSLAAVFGPDVVVSQHGADSHAWDPLAHLRVTTTAMAEAARIVDAVAHRWAGGRWLATGGGGYDIYRVVPRAWALTWLAGAHREPPDVTPVEWRERWAADAARFGIPGMPGAFEDAPNVGTPVDSAQAAAEARSLAMLERVRVALLPRLIREAEDRGWWWPGLAWAGRSLVPGAGAALPAVESRGGARVAARGTPMVRALEAGDLDRLRLDSRTVPPFDPEDGRSLLAAALAGGARVFAAIDGVEVAGVGVAAPSLGEAGVESLLALGVAPAYRASGLGRALLRALVDGRPPGTRMEAHVGVAERDVVEPLAVETRIGVARRLLAEAGFEIRPPSPDIARDDPRAIAARLGTR
jgi:acetoin utilization protein AcuC